MTVEAYINSAIDLGANDGLTALASDQRAVFLISEAEVFCDMGGGLQALVAKHGADAIQECAKAFLGIGATEIGNNLSGLDVATLESSAANRAMDLISDRSGYNYSAIEKWILSQAPHLTMTEQGAAPNL